MTVWKTWQSTLSTAMLISCFLLWFYQWCTQSTWYKYVWNWIQGGRKSLYSFLWRVMSSSVSFEGHTSVNILWNESWIFCQLLLNTLVKLQIWNSSKAIFEWWFLMKFLISGAWKCNRLTHTFQSLLTLYFITILPFTMFFISLVTGRNEKYL